MYGRSFQSSYLYNADNGCLHTSSIHTYIHVKTSTLKALRWDPSPQMAACGQSHMIMRSIRLTGGALVPRSCRMVWMKGQTRALHNHCTTPDERAATGAHWYVHEGGSCSGKGVGCVFLYPDLHSCVCLCVREYTNTWILLFDVHCANKYTGKHWHTHTRNHVS